MLCKELLLRIIYTEGRIPIVIPFFPLSLCSSRESIPNRLFFALAAPLLLRSPKAFEAVLRISADLAGFTPSHSLLGQRLQHFYVQPFA